MWRAALTVALLAVLHLTSGATIVVPCPGQSCSIAVLANITLEGNDTLILEAGTYGGPCEDRVFSGDGYSIRGEGQVTIDCDYSGAPFQLSGAGVVTVSGITFTRCACGSGGNGVAAIQSSVPVVLDQCSFTNLSCGAIVSNSPLSIIGSTFDTINAIDLPAIQTSQHLYLLDTQIYNVFGTQYGAIYATQTVIFENSTFVNCTTSFSTGGVIFINSLLTVENCTFINNGGSAIFASSSVEITNSLFIANTGTNGAAINANCYGCSTTFINCNFISNAANTYNTIPPASGDGGAIYSQGQVTIYNCNFIENYSPDVNNAGGGALAVFAIGETILSVVIVNTTFIRNQAALSGGAIYFSSTVNTTFINCSLIDNYALASGGAIYSGGDLTFIDVICSSNTAAAGGCIYIAPGGLTVARSTLNYNSAYQYCGGAIHVQSSACAVRNSVLAFNYAGQYGGGMYIQSSSDSLVTTSAFHGNTAVNSAYATQGGGGAICVDAANVQMSEVDFADNVAYGLGGGAVLEKSGGVGFTGCTITASETQLLPAFVCLSGALEYTSSNYISGSVTGGLPFFQAQDCGACPLPSAFNGSSLLSSCAFFPNVPCEYTCANDSTALLESVSCLSENQPFHLPPLCSTPPTCPTPYIAHGQPDVCTGVLGSFCNFTCDSGFKANKGSVGFCQDITWYPENDFACVRVWTIEIVVGVVGGVLIVLGAFGAYKLRQRVLLLRELGTSESNNTDESPQTEEDPLLQPRGGIQ